MRGRRAGSRAADFHSRLRVGAVAAVVLLMAQVAHALAIEQTLWNFDGRIQPQRMNLFSVLVSNPTPRALDATLTLSKRMAGSPVGLRQVEACYLSPGSSRWVQFQVLINYGSEDFELSWGRSRDDRMDLPPLQSGPQAVALLRGPGDLTGRGVGFPSFPMELFPPTVSATDQLHAVVLDAAIAMDEARRIAFREWVHRGGIVHLLPDALGRWPVFSGDLAVLQSVEPRHRVGSGMIVRHDATRQSLTLQKLSDMGFATPTIERSGGESAAQAILRVMGQMTQPEHAWGLIFTLAVAYVVMVGPVGLVLARRQRDYRLSLLLLVVLVIGFSGAFLTLGRRGYGEQSTVHSVALARPVGGGWYDLTQYVQVFVTRGDEYAIRSAASHSAFSTVFDTERADGIARSGAPGEVVVDLPLFSQRELLHRGRAQGPAQMVAVTQWPDAQHADLGLSVDETVGAVRQAWLVGGSHLQTCNMDTQRRLISGQRQTLDVLRTWDVFGGYQQYGPSDPSADLRRREWLAKRLIAEELGLSPQNGNVVNPTQTQSDDFIAAPTYHVFLLTDAPATMAITGQGLGPHTGLVLYHVQLHRPTTEPQP